MKFADQDHICIDPDYNVGNGCHCPLQNRSARTTIGFDLGYIEFPDLNTLCEFYHPEPDINVSELYHSG